MCKSFFFVFWSLLSTLLLAQLPSPLGWPVSNEDIDPDIFRVHPSLSCQKKPGIYLAIGGDRCLLHAVKAQIAGLNIDQIICLDRWQDVLDFADDLDQFIHSRQQPLADMWELIRRGFSERWDLQQIHSLLFKKMARRSAWAFSLG